MKQSGKARSEHYEAKNCVQYQVKRIDEVKAEWKV